MPKEKRRGPNSSQQQAVNPSHSSSSSSPSSTTPKNQKKKKGSKGSSPPRLDPFSPGTNTSNLKVFDPTSGLQFAWNDFRKLSKDELKTIAPPKQRLFSSGVNCCARCGMWFKMKHGKTICDANRPKDLEEHEFEVPERLRETLPSAALPQMQLWPWLIIKKKKSL